MTDIIEYTHNEVVTSWMDYILQTIADCEDNGNTAEETLEYVRYTIKTIKHEYKTASPPP